MGWGVFSRGTAAGIVVDTGAEALFRGGVYLVGILLLVLLFVPGWGRGGGVREFSRDTVAGIVVCTGVGVGVFSRDTAAGIVVDTGVGVGCI